MMQIVFQNFYIEHIKLDESNVDCICTFTLHVNFECLKRKIYNTRYCQFYSNRYLKYYHFRIQNIAMQI